MTSLKMARHFKSVGNKRGPISLMLITLNFYNTNNCSNVKMRLLSLTHKHHVHMKNSSMSNPFWNWNETWEKIRGVPLKRWYHKLSKIWQLIFTNCWEIALLQITSSRYLNKFNNYHVRKGELNPFHSRTNWLKAGEIIFAIIGFYSI